jgi:uncharacterized membrane protein
MSEGSDPEAPAEPPPPTAYEEPAPPPQLMPQPDDAQAAAPPFEVQPPTPRRRRLRWMRPRELAIFLRGALLLSLAGFFLAALAMQLTGAFRSRAVWNLTEFISHNQLATKARMAMLAWLGAGLLLGAVGALVIYAWRGGRTGPTRRAARVLRAGRLAWPLMLPSLAWDLLAAAGDGHSRMAGIAILAGLAEMSVRAAAAELVRGQLAFARFLARAWEGAGRRLARARRFAPRPFVTVLLAAAFYAVWMSVTTILQHRHFGTASADLGNTDTMFFNALHGHPFRCPSLYPKGPSWSMLSTHAELTMFALLPLYALHPGAETLLVLQALALASGAIPLYRLAARRLPEGTALVLALAYLLYAPMHQANFFDVHFPPFAAAFTLWALDLLDARRLKLFVLFFALAIGCREDVAAGFAALGVYLLLTGKRPRAALALTAVSLAYVVVMTAVVMPRFEGAWYTDPYKTVGGAFTYGGAVKTLLVNPLYAWKMLATVPQLTLFLMVLAPVAFLPLRRRFLWLGLVPLVPFAVITTGYNPPLALCFQFVMLYVPYLFASAAVAMAGLRNGVGGRVRLAGIVAGLVTATFLTTRVWGAMPPGEQAGGGFRVIPQLTSLTALERQKARDLSQLAAKVPREASLATTDAELPHVSARVDCLALRNGYEGAAGPADYILYAEDGVGAEYARAAMTSGAYEVVESRPATKLSLLRKKKH